MFSSSRSTNSLTLVTEERTGNVQLLAADNDDALTSEGLLGNNGGKATQEMAFTVDDNHLKRRVEKKKFPLVRRVLSSKLVLRLNSIG